MTPEEAKPRTGIEVEYAESSELWFTAKETAEIAKAYSDLKLEADAVKAWEVLFEEWSK